MKTKLLPNSKQILTRHFVVNVFFVGIHLLVLFLIVKPPIEDQIYFINETVQTLQGTVQNQMTNLERQNEELENKVRKAMAQTVQDITTWLEKENGHKEEFLQKLTTWKTADPAVTDHLDHFAFSDLSKFPTFADFIGMEAEKEAVQNFVHYVQHPEVYKTLGQVRPPSGILLYGLPGCGKTDFAQALARETGLAFIEVSAPDFSKTYKGEAPRMVKSLFKQAREKAQQGKGVIIFLDECEVLFSDLTCSQLEGDVANVVNQFKTEMTSLANDPTHPVFLVGATNHYNQIDEAIKSRFTYKIQVNPLKEAQREQLFNWIITKRANPYSAAARAYFAQTLNPAITALSQTEEYLAAGRFLFKLAEDAVLICARRKINAEDLRQVEIADLQQAYRNIFQADATFLPDGSLEKKHRGFLRGGVLSVPVQAMLARTKEERIQAEADRERAEADRERAEADRERAEVKRIQAEAEAERIQAEAKRIQAEAEAEAKRIQAEADRENKSRGIGDGE